MEYLPFFKLQYFQIISRTAVDLPLSVWYLTFYCNPRLKLAVFNKILMQGLNATAVSYGKYIEKYLHSEDIYEGEETPDLNLLNSIEKPSFGVYNVSNELNVFLYQTLYILLTPIIASKEIFLAIKNSLMRDFSKTSAVGAGLNPTD